MKERAVVIGAGLAGATCAYLLRLAGVEVTVLERLDLSRKSKLCGGLVTPRSMLLLSGIFGDEVDRLYQDEFHAMRCVAGEHEVDVGRLYMRSLQRSELDALAVDACIRAGAEVMDRTSVHDLDLRSRTVTAYRDGREQVRGFDVLVAADGALSSTRKKVAGSCTDSILTIEASVEASGEPLTMLYTPELYGYCWYIPVGEHAKIGCGSFRDPSLLDQHLAGFAKRVGVRLPRHRGAYLPTGKDVLLQQGDVLFLGDAAGLICPPSGEGIYYALRSAEMAARAIANGASYEQLMDADARTVAREYRTRDLFFDKRLMDIGIGLAELTPYGRERAVRWALRHFCSF